MVFNQTHLENFSSIFAGLTSVDQFSFCALFEIVIIKKEKRRWRCPSGYASLWSVSNLFDSSLRFKPTYKCANFFSALVIFFEIIKNKRVTLVQT